MKVDERLNVSENNPIENNNPVEIKPAEKASTTVASATITNVSSMVQQQTNTLLTSNYNTMLSSEVIQKALVEIRQKLLPEYNNSGLHDIEIIRLLEMSQKHLAESHDTPSHTSMQYYFTGGYFLYITLLLRNVGSVVLPDPNLITATTQDQIDKMLLLSSQINSPTTILACTFISSSVCSLTYWISEELFSMSLGKSLEFRSF